MHLIRLLKKLRYKDTVQDNFRHSFRHIPYTERTYGKTSQKCLKVYNDYFHGLKKMVDTIVAKDYNNRYNQKVGAQANIWTVLNISLVICPASHLKLEISKISVLLELCPNSKYLSISNRLNLIKTHTYLIIYFQMIISGLLLFSLGFVMNAISDKCI